MVPDNDSPSHQRIAASSADVSRTPVRSAKRLHVMLCALVHQHGMVQSRRCNDLKLNINAG